MADDENCTREADGKSSRLNKDMKPAYTLGAVFFCPIRYCGDWYGKVNSAPTASFGPATDQQEILTTYQRCDAHWGSSLSFTLVGWH